MTDTATNKISHDDYETPLLTDHGLISELTEASATVTMNFNPDGVASYTS